MTGFLDSHKVVAKRDAFLTLPSAQNGSKFFFKTKKTMIIIIIIIKSKVNLIF